MKRKKSSYFYNRILRAPAWAYIVLFIVCIAAAFFAFFYDSTVAENVFYGVLGSLVVAVFIDLGNTRSDRIEKERLREQANLDFKEKCGSIPFMLWDLTGHPVGEKAYVDKMIIELFRYDSEPYDKYEEALNAFAFNINRLKTSLENYLSCCFSESDRKETPEYKKLIQILGPINGFLIHYESHKRYVDNAIVLEKIIESKSNIDTSGDEILGPLYKNVNESCIHMGICVNRIVSKIKELYPEYKEFFEKEYQFL